MPDGDPLLICLTFDACHDQFDSSVRLGEDNGKLNWLGIERGIPEVEKVLGGIPATWFVRCDRQLNSIYGNHDYLLKTYETLWESLKAAGGEIAWHPHLYGNQNGIWAQETVREKLIDDLVISFEAFKKYKFVSYISRIGEAYSSNSIMACLDNLKIICDSTAMPGRSRKDEERNMDWKISPPGPYYPSRQDYRVPGSDHFRLLEIPMTMVPVKAEYDKEEILRYVDLGFWHHALRKGVQGALSDAAILVTITHPSTVLRNSRSNRHGLLSFDRDEFKKNLDFIRTEADNIGRQIEFVTLSEAARVVTGKMNLGHN